MADIMADSFGDCGDAPTNASISIDYGGPLLRQIAIGPRPDTGHPLKGDVLSCPAKGGEPTPDMSHQCPGHVTPGGEECGDR